MSLSPELSDAEKRHSTVIPKWRQPTAPLYVCICVMCEALHTAIPILSMFLINTRRLAMINHVHVCIMVTGGGAAMRLYQLVAAWGEVNIAADAPRVQLSLLTFSFPYMKLAQNRNPPSKYKQTHFSTFTHQLHNTSTLSWPQQQLSKGSLILQLLFHLYSINLVSDKYQCGQLIHIVPRVST